jgi:AraC-like DNA-binding protein
MSNMASSIAAAPTINLASVVYGLEGYVQGLGADPARILQRAELVAEDLADPERRAPLIRYLELLEICAAELGDPHFGLSFGLQYDPRHAGVVGNVALASRTVRDALRAFGRYLPTMVDSAVFGLEVEDDMAFAYSYYVDPLLMRYQQKNDWAVAFVCNLIRHGINDADWGPTEALFPHLPSESPSERRGRARLLRTAIRVGHPWAGIRFDASILDQPMATADHMISRLMQHYGDLRLSGLENDRDEISVLRRNIAQLVIQGDTHIESLARRTGWSVRTLQRRLTTRGLNYSDMLEDVRKTLALNLLQNAGLCVSQIAYSIGYSDVSAFNHAFRRWVGQSPRDYRKARQESHHS